MLEIHVHASEAVLHALVAGPGLLRCPPSGPAERLMQRAIHEAQLALALEQGAACGGHDVSGARFEEWAAGLEKLSPQARRAEVRAAVERSRVARALAEPCKLVLCGRQNAGKSTLMNRLLVRERVLAGGTPGLTRDPVREVTSLEGYPYELVDTAGEGELEGAADRAALQRGRAEREGAWLLLVVDGSRPPDASDRSLSGDRSVVVRSKSDLAPAAWGDLREDLESTCLDEAVGPELRGRLGRVLRRRRRLPEAGPVGGPAALDDGQARVLQAISDSG